jgi:hypothetical protein
MVKPSRQKQPVPDHDVFDLCTYAAEVLIRAGFQWHETSRQTESCYYKFPGRDGVLRVGTHKRKKPDKNKDRIYGKITFAPTPVLSPPGMIRMTEQAIESKIAYAIGTYLMKAPVKNHG